MPQKPRAKPQEGITAALNRVYGSNLQESRVEDDVLTRQEASVSEDWTLCECDAFETLSVPCGCGAHELRLFRDRVYHRRGGHWDMQCIARRLSHEAASRAPKTFRRLEHRTNARLKKSGQRFGIRHLAQMPDGTYRFELSAAITPRQRALLRRVLVETLSPLPRPAKTSRGPKNRR
jgi:hypothetical protein